MRKGKNLNEQLQEIKLRIQIQLEVLCMSMLKMFTIVSSRFLKFVFAGFIMVTSGLNVLYFSEQLVS